MNNMQNKINYIRMLMLKKNQQLFNQQLQNQVLQNNHILNDKEIEDKVNETIQKLIPYQNNRRIRIINSHQIIKYFSNNTQSLRVYLLDNYVVCKIFKRDHKGFIFWKNELKTLQKLLYCNYAPTLLAYDQFTIYMTYCGEGINKKNIPQNWKDQINDIFTDLRKKKINPNDVINKNICVLNNHIKLIDYGLANDNMIDLHNYRKQVLLDLSKIR